MPVYAARTSREPARVGERAPLILVVEDDPSTSRLLAEVLTDEGYQTLQTGSAIVGLRLVRQYQPAVVVLDLMLSEGSGLDLLRGVKEAAATRYVPILVLSAAEELMHHPIALQADAILPKPFQVGSVLKQIRRLVRRDPEPLGRRLASISA